MRMSSVPRLVIAAFAIGISSGRALAAQASAAQRVGAQAKALLGDAKSEAKKWRSDAYLFQVTARGVTDGLAMWYYDFIAPGASGKKCLRVNFGKDRRVFTRQLDCDQSDPELKDFAVDSDRAVEIARKEGLKRPQLTAALSMVPTAAGQRAIWILMEGNGMTEGDVTIDIDAQTGAIRGKRKL